MTPPIERVFLGWRSSALEAAAAHLASHYATAREIRLDRTALILPGRRAGRRLIEILIDEAAARGLRLRPPRTETVGACPELLYRAARPPADAVLARRVWARALRDSDRDRLARVFPHPPDPDDATAWDQLARQVEGLHREVGAAGLSFRDIADRCGQGDGYDDGARWNVLAEVQAAYLATLDSLGRADREFARLDALERGEVASDRELWLIGIAEMPGVVRRMLGALDSPVRALVHSPPERADAFDDHGCVRPLAWRDAEIPLEDDDIAIGDRPADQAAEAVRAIAALDARYTADQITIGVPDDAVVPYLDQRLSADTLPARYGAGVRLHRTAPYRLLEAFAEYLADRRFDALAALLRHPDVRPGPDSPSGEPRELLAVADEYFSRTLPARLARPLAGDAPTRAAIEPILDALEDGSLLGRMTGRRRLAEWAPEILALLAAVYGDRELDPNDRADHRLVEACARIREAAAGFHTLPAAVDERVDAATAIRLVLSEAARATIPPEPDDAAIELLGWLELHLDDAPALVITGFNEPYLPESVNADAFLPNTLRTRLGLTDNELRYARDAYRFTAILRSRPYARVIAGRRDAAGDPLRPSRLLFAAPDAVVAKRVLRFHDERGADPSPTPPDARPPTESAFRLPIEPEIRAPEPITSLRVTDFRGLLRDPYRWALERVLRLKPLDDHARELDGAAFGSLAHEVLHRFGTSDPVHADDAATVRAALDALLDEFVRRRFGRAALPAVDVQVEQLRARLHALAEWHAAWIGDGWRVVRAEWQPDGGVPFDVDDAPILLRGRIDRVDRNARTGEWALLDYKTSDSPTDPERSHRKSRDSIWVDLQLPLYRHLLPALEVDGEPVGPVEPAAIRLGYILLPRDLAEVGVALADWTDDDLADADEAAHEAVRTVRENRFTFDPDRVRTYRDDPLAVLLGEGRLATSADADPDDGDDG